MGGLTAWLQSNCPPGRELTHVGLKGGRYTVPPGLEEAFLKKYNSKLQAGEPQYLVEQRTPVFRLFADLDWRSTAPVSPDVQLDVAKFVAQQVMLIWELDEPLQAVVCTRKAALDSASGTFKCGMHLHWPGILTDTETALTFRQAAVERCREHFGENVMGMPWETVLDDHVYRTSGLRMVFSRKKEQQDVYQPTWNLELSSVDEGGLKQPIVTSRPCHDDPLLWVSLCSLRYHGHCRTPVQDCVTPAREHGQERETAEDCSLAEHAAGLEELRTVLAPCHRTCKFRKLLRGASGKYILSTDCRVCLNLQPRADGSPEAHRSNLIYFVIDRDHFYQACHCNCDTEAGRVRGPCKGFRSNGIQTPARLASSLFGPAETTPVTFCNPASADDVFKRFFQPPSKPAKRKKARKAA